MIYGSSDTFDFPSIDTYPDVVVTGVPVFHSASIFFYGVHFIRLSGAATTLLKRPMLSTGERLARSSVRLWLTDSAGLIPGITLSI